MRLALYSIYTQFSLYKNIHLTPYKNIKTINIELTYKQWLRKLAESRKLREISDAELAEHEKNPDWLQDKAK
jgi:hypothetical protein